MTCHLRPLPDDISVEVIENVSVVSDDLYRKAKRIKTAEKDDDDS